MLENLVADVLSRFLGQYVEGLETENIQVGLWSGKLSLRSLALRPEAAAVFMDSLGLDVGTQVKKGEIGELEVSVPWKNIWNASSTICLKKLRIEVAAVTNTEQVNEESTNSKRKRQKKAKLAADDAIRGTRRQALLEAKKAGDSKQPVGTTKPSTTTWYYRLLARVVSNVQIDISDVFIKCQGESDNSFSTASYFYLKQMSIKSTDHDWKECLGGNAGEGAILNKLVRLQDCSFFVGESDKTMGNIFANEDVLHSEVIQRQRVFGPFSATLQMKLKNPMESSPESEDIPHAVLDFKVYSLDFELDRSQYTSLLSLVDSLSHETRKPIRPIDKWKWAVEKISPGLEQRIRPCVNLDVEKMKERRKRMQDYMELRKQYLMKIYGQTFRGDNSKENVRPMRLEQLEDELELEDILLYRDIVDESLEDIFPETSLLNTSSNSEQNTKSMGWAQWITSYFVTSKESKQSETSDSFVSAEEGTIDSTNESTDWKQEMATCPSKELDNTVFRADFDIESASFTLYGKNASGNKLALGKVLVEGFSFGLEKRSLGALRFDFLFRQFCVYDCRRGENVEVVTRKLSENYYYNISATSTVIQDSLRDQIDQILHDPLQADKQNYNQFLGAMKIEITNSLSFDQIDGVLGGLELRFTDPLFIKQIAQIIEPPQQKSFLLESVSLNAKRGLAEMRNYLGQHLYKKKKPWKVRFLVEGPSVLIGSNYHNESLLVNMGTLKVMDCPFSSVLDHVDIEAEKLQQSFTKFSFYEVTVDDCHIKHQERLNKFETVHNIVLKPISMRLHFISLIDGVGAKSLQDVPLIVKHQKYHSLFYLLGKIPMISISVTPQLVMFLKDFIMHSIYLNWSMKHDSERLNYPVSNTNSYQVNDLLTNENSIENLVNGLEFFSYFTFQLTVSQIVTCFENVKHQSGLLADWTNLQLGGSFLFHERHLCLSCDDFAVGDTFSGNRKDFIFASSVIDDDQKRLPCFSLDAQFSNQGASNNVNVCVLPLSIHVYPDVCRQMSGMGYHLLFSNGDWERTLPKKEEATELGNNANQMASKEFNSRVVFQLKKVTIALHRNDRMFALLCLNGLEGYVSLKDNDRYEGEGFFERISLYNMTCGLENLKQVLCLPVNNDRGHWFLSKNMSKDVANLCESLPELQISVEHSYLVFLSAFMTALKAHTTQTLELLLSGEDQETSYSESEKSSKIRTQRFAPFLVTISSKFFDLYIPRGCASYDSLKLSAKDFILRNKLECAVNYNVGFLIIANAVDGMLYQFTSLFDSSVSQDSFCEPFLLNAQLEFDIDTSSVMDSTLTDTEPPPDVFIRMKSQRQTSFRVSEVQYTTMLHILYYNLSEDLEKAPVSDVFPSSYEESDLSSSPENSLPGLWLLNRRSPNKIPVGYRAILEFPQFSVVLFSGATNTSNDAISSIKFHGMSFFVDYYDDGRLSIETIAIHASMEDMRPCVLYGKKLVESIVGTEQTSSNEQSPPFVMKYYGWPESASVYSFTLSSLKLFVVADFIRSVYRLSVPFSDPHCDPWLLRAEASEESTATFNQPYYGKQVNFVFSNCQFYLPVDPSSSDSHVLVLGGELVSKYNISCKETGTYRLIGRNIHGSLGFVSKPDLLRAIYPFELSLEYSFGTDSQVLQINSESVLCRLGIHDAPILFSVLWRLFAQETVSSSAINKDRIEKREISVIDRDRIPFDIKWNIQGIRLVALEETDLSCIPIAEIRIDKLQGTLRDFLCGQLALEIAAFLFNEKKGWWEPTVESWPCKLNFSIGEKNTLVFELISDYRININVSQVVVEGAMKATSNMFHALKHIQEKTFVCDKAEYQLTNRRPSVAAFVVRNELGFPISLKFPYDSGKYVCWEGQEKEADIRTDELVRSLTRASSEDSGKPYRKRKKSALTSVLDMNQTDWINSCTIQVPGYEVVSLSTSEYGVHLVPLKPAHSTSVQSMSSFQSSSSVDGNEYDNFTKVTEALAVWEVSVKSGVPYCTLRSKYQILNKTKITIQVSISHTSQVATISPSEVFSVPLGFEYETLYLRPCISRGVFFENEVSEDVGIYSWSNGLDSFHELWRKATLIVREERKMLQKSRHESYSNMEWMRHIGKFISFCHCDRLLEEHELGIDEFSFLLFPRVDEKRPLGWENGWLDLEIHPPVTLENRLPREVAFRMMLPKGRMSQMFHSSEHLASTVAEGVLQPLQIAQIFSISGDITEASLKLRYDNLPRPSRNKPNYDGFMKRADVPDWGQSAMMSPDTRIELYSFGTGESVLPKGLNLRSQRVFARLEMAEDEKLGYHFKVVAEFWIRNKSSSAINVRVISEDAISYFSFAPCPPREPVDPFVVFDASEVAFAVAGRDSYVPLMTSLNDIDKPLELDLFDGNYILEVRPGKDRFNRSLVVIIRDSIRIENRTKYLLQWCQADAAGIGGDDDAVTIMGVHEDYVHDIPSGNVVAIHWDFKDKSKLFSLRRTEDRYSREWQWSRPVSPEYQGDIFLKMYSPRRHEQYIPVVRAHAPIGGSRSIVVLEEDRRYPPYQIVNLCRSRAIAFHQVGTSHDFPPWLVRPGRSTRYAWDDPCSIECKKKLLTVEVVELPNESDSVTSNGKETLATRYPEFEIVIDVVSRKFTRKVLPKDPAILYAVMVNGPTKVVTFVDEGTVNANDAVSVLAKISSSVVKNPQTAADSNASLTSLGGQEFVVKEQEIMRPETFSNSSPEEEKNSRALQFNVSLSSVGLSFIDSSPVELAYLTLTNVNFDYKTTSDGQVYDFSAGDLQLDNQLPNAQWPVIVWPSDRRAEVVSAEEEASSSVPNVNKPVFQATLEKSPRSFPGIQAFTGIYFALQRLHVSLEEYFLRHCWPFLQLLFRLDASSQDECLEGEDEDCRRKLEESGDTNSLLFHERLYVEWLLFGPIQLIVSFSSAASSVRYGPYRKFIRVLLATIGNVEGAEFRFNALELHHAFDTESHLRALIKEFYVSQVMNQRMKLLSSNSLFGNPAALFDSIALGAKDFFVEPSKAVGGRDFILRLDKGSKSLVTNTVGGLLNSINQIPRSLSVGLATAVGSKEYLADREMKRSRQPTSAVDGFFQGAKYFGEGISKGVSGVFRDPYQGAKREGAAGFFKGLGKGLVGGVVHPMTGMLDFIAEPAAGLRNMTVGGLQQGALPMRPPRSMGALKQLTSYDVHTATGRAIMQAIIPGSDEEHEEPLYWVELDNLFPYTPSKAVNDEKSPEWQLAAIVTLFTRSGRHGKNLAKELLRAKVQSSLHGNGLSKVPRNFRGRAALITTRRFMISTFDGKVLWQRKLRHILDAKVTKSPRGSPALAICVLHARTEQGYLWERMDCPSQSSVESICRVLLKNIRSIDKQEAVGELSSTSHYSSSLGRYTEDESDEDVDIDRGGQIESSVRNSTEESGDMLGDIFEQMSTVDEGSIVETVRRDSHASQSFEKLEKVHGESELKRSTSYSSQRSLVASSSKSVTESIQSEVKRCMSLPSSRSLSCKRSLRIIIVNQLWSSLYLVDAVLTSGLWCQEPATQIPSSKARVCEAECSKGVMRGIEGSLVFAYADSSTDSRCWLTIRFTHTFLTTCQVRVKVPHGLQYHVVEDSTEHSTCVVTFSPTNENVSIPKENQIVTKEPASQSVNKSPVQTATVPDDEAVVQLAEMGFDPVKAYQALQATNNDISNAVRKLLDEDV
eukprot:jgi/Galph1/571/GphlegSOOS_G5311.1